MANTSKVGLYGSTAFLRLLQLMDYTFFAVCQYWFSLYESLEACEEPHIYPVDVKCFSADIPYQCIQCGVISNTRPGAHQISFFATVGNEIEIENHLVLLRLLDVVNYLPNSHDVGRSSELPDDGAPIVDNSFCLVNYTLIFELESASHLVCGDVHVCR